MSHKGKFITFEGGEGSGKTTQSRMLAERLRSDGYKVIHTREPGGTPISDKIRAILLDGENVAMCKQCEFLLYTAARSQHVQEVIIPAVESGAIVICDRFVDSTVVYQHHVRESATMEFIEQTNDYLSGDAEFRKPSLTFLFDIDAEIGLKRSVRRLAAASGPDESRFENLPIEFHTKVNHYYRMQAERNKDRIIMLDATQSIEFLHERVYQEVIKRIA